MDLHLFVSLCNCLFTPLVNTKLTKQLSNTGLIETDLKSTIGALHYLHKTGKLWQGLTLQFLTSFSTEVINGILKKFFGWFFSLYGKGERSVTTTFLLTTLSGFCSLIITHPIELIRTKVVCSDKYSSSWDCFIKTKQEKNLSGLYSGFWMHNLSFFPHSFYITCYTAGQTILLHYHSQSSFWSKFAVALMSTGLAQILVYPLNTITKAQMLCHASVTQVVERIYGYRGLAGFFGGFTVDVLQIITASLLIAIVSEIKLLLFRVK
eukprot:TRINITY_DN4328_c0_g1_i10.p1 TRINITY_DN4328_c0_g1~~TRINITY_DN4328_c0_g1_i10.p1  ORF type:complete len:265 (-),score=17.16 TRINITY_DN4328_c0_g1_i10:361-1155(-)